ncbi:MAG: indole-3-glycerol phosphate synthase TrpC [Gammaproteobacteria bacterium]|nr:indole-3-glycerol phosphate synthase TrpC [Gammaproteobacteria bacterium]
MNSAGILAEIIAHKRSEVAAAKAERPQSSIEAELADASAPRDFAGALRERIADGRPAVIAEVKRASPSKGLIRENFDASRHAADYAEAGAACLSVLTDGKYFRGSLDDLRAARAAADLPLLRKDFMIDSWQIAESRLAGADCILLIAAALSDAEMAELAACAAELNLDVLVEVHDREELERALSLDCELIGINNRDLRDFHTSLNTTFDLLPQVPSDRLLITESGIGGPGDMRMMMDRGVYGFLIGETFMRAPEPGAELRNMLRGAAVSR